MLASASASPQRPPPVRLSQMRLPSRAFAARLPALRMSPRASEFSAARFLPVLAFFFSFFSFSFS